MVLCPSSSRKHISKPSPTTSAQVDATYGFGRGPRKDEDLGPSSLVHCPKLPDRHRSGAPVSSRVETRLSPHWHPGAGGADPKLPPQAPCGRGAPEGWARGWSCALPPPAGLPREFATETLVGVTPSVALSAPPCCSEPPPPCETLACPGTPLPHPGQVPRGVQGACGASQAWVWTCCTGPLGLSPCPSPVPLPAPPLPEAPRQLAHSTLWT